MSTNNNFDSAVTAPLDKSVANDNTSSSSSLLNEVLQASYQTNANEGAKSGSNANQFLPQLTIANSSPTSTPESAGNSFLSGAANVVTDISNLAQEWEGLDAGNFGAGSSGNTSPSENSNSILSRGSQFFADLGAADMQVLDMGLSGQLGDSAGLSQGFQQVQQYLAKMQGDLTSIGGGQNGNAGQGGEGVTTGGTGGGTGGAGDGGTAPTSDPIIQSLQQSDPQAAQLLKDSQSAMSPAGFAQYETALQQNIEGGHYADVLSAANAATGQLQSSGDTADLNAAAAVINAEITPSNDAPVSTYSAANDSQVQNLANTGDSQLQQTLQSAWSNVQNGQLSAYGYSQFENASIPLTNDYGVYQNDTQLEQAAFNQLPSLSTSDQSTLAGLIGQNTTAGNAGTGSDTGTIATGNGGTGSDSGSGTGNNGNGDGPSVQTGGGNVPGGWTANTPSELQQVFPVEWGNVSASTDANGNPALKLSAGGGQPNVAQTGVMQSDSSTTDGNGYGTYSITASGLQSGDYLDLWSANNQWPGGPTQGQEVDLWENWGGTQIATRHYAGADGSNQYDSVNYPAGFDPSQENTYTVVWAPNQQGTPEDTLYVNSGGAGGGPLTKVASWDTNVYADAAHGGSNESFGMGSETAEGYGNNAPGSTGYIESASYTPWNGTPQANS